MPKKQSTMTLEQFVDSLDARQRAFFLAREAELEDRYQKAFKAGCEVLGILGGLQGQAALERLERDSR